VFARAEELAVGHVFTELVIYPALHWVRPQNVVAAQMKIRKGGAVDSDLRALRSQETEEFFLRSLRSELLVCLTVRGLGKLKVCGQGAVHQTAHPAVHTLLLSLNGFSPFQGRGSVSSRTSMGGRPVAAEACDSARRSLEQASAHARTLRDAPSQIWSHVDRRGRPP
jgi:hypothetical protein